MVKERLIFGGFVAAAIILVLLNGNLIFDNVFWTDEVCSINLIQESYWDGIMTTAADVHPPLYYLLLKTLCQLLGYQGWVYHLASVIPFGLLCVLAITGIRRTFGNLPAVMLMIMCGLSFVGVTYNVEVRMYSWAVCFMTACFYEAYQVLQTNRTKHWILFTLAALCCAYTHYFCLLSAALLASGVYIVQGVSYGLARKDMTVAEQSDGDHEKHCGRKILLSIGIAVVGYLPWLTVLLHTFVSTSEDYWIEGSPSLKACIKWSFGETSVSTKMMMITTAVCVLALIYDIVQVKCKRKRIDRTVRNTVMMALGIWTILGTILTGIMVTALVRPLLQLRYLSQLIGIAAICAGIAMQKCFGFGKWLMSRLHSEKYVTEKLSGTLTILLTGMLLVVMVFFARDGYAVVRQEYITQKRDTDSALSCISGNQLEQNVMLVSNSRMTVKYYYPDAELRKYDAETFPDMLSQEPMTLLLKPDTMTEVLWQEMEDKGYMVESYGILNLAAEIYDVYKIDKIQ